MEFVKKLQKDCEQFTCSFCKRQFKAFRALEGVKGGHMCVSCAKGKGKR